MIPEPAISRKSLILGAALTWSVGGVILIVRAASLMGQVDRSLPLALGIAVVIGLLKGKLIFERVARKNVARIRSTSPHKDKICLFAFQSLQSYLIVISMIVLGILLRQVGLRPLYLVMVYTAIGVALLVSSGLYYREARRSDAA